MKILVLGQVWPEPTSSAAGSRMMQLIACAQQAKCQVHFASAAARGIHAVDFDSLGIRSHTIALNDSTFDRFISDLKPEVVLFDRFMVEEQFGWRVVENCPSALRILDTEDLHGLRKAREQALKQNRPFTEADLINDFSKREIASIYRCDLSLIISEFEMKLLLDFFGVPKQQLLYLPFLVDDLTEDQQDQLKPFADRKDFVTIGNFRHAPNWDAVRHLKEQIWPMIRLQLPEAKMHVYGAYASPKVSQLHSAKQGFFIHGRAKSSQEVIEKARVLLAPLRTGAGLKGKLLEAMQCGTPSITTAIGAEGMNGDLNWPGFIEDDPSAFAQKAIELYTNENHWLQAQDNGFAIINKRFQKSVWSQQFTEAVTAYHENLKEYRLKNFTGAMLQHQSLQATKFMGKWIEEKNR